MELGFTTFGDLTPDPATGERRAAGQRLEEIVGLAQIADAAGLDVVGIGEHHRSDFAVSSPPVVMGALAHATQRIRMTSAVTVLSTLDPVRVFEDYATADLLSGGRVELIAGRGVFLEPFPLFGYDLDDYPELFAEKLDLLLQVARTERVTWSGRFRPALHDAAVAPRPAQDQMPIWMAIGGTPDSAVQAGRRGLPLMMAIIGGSPRRFAPLADLYRRAFAEGHHDAGAPRLGVNSHTCIAPRSQDARAAFFPYYASYMAHMLPRGGARITREAYDELCGPEGALFVGSPQEVAEKLERTHEALGLERFLAHIDVGGQPYEQVAQSVELLATEVGPALRNALAVTGAR
jgi:probable LLM family oxidoreductase